MKKLFFRLMLRPTKVIYTIFIKVNFWIGNLITTLYYRYGILAYKNPLKHVWRVTLKGKRKAGKLLTYVHRSYYYERFGIKNETN